MTFDPLGNAQKTMVIPSGGCHDCGGRCPYLIHVRNGKALRIRREFIYLKTGEVQTETSFGLTSLTVQEANPEQVLSHVRGQWSMKKLSHYVRDIAYDEDRAQIRKGKGPQMMA